MDNKEAVHDLKAIKDFFEQESGAYPICLEYAIKVLEQTEPRKTADYCDDCNHKGCDNCVADSRDDYCTPSNYQKQTEPQTDCMWK